MHTAAYSVKPSGFRGPQRNGQSTGSLRNSALRLVAVPPGLQFRRQGSVARATAAEGTSATDFGSLFSDAISGKSTIIPSQQLPDAPISPPPESVASQAFSRPDSVGSPEPKSQALADVAPAPPQPIPQAAERLTDANDALPGSFTGSSDPMQKATDIMPAEPQASASDFVTSVADSATSAVDSAQSAANDAATSVQETVFDMIDSGSAAASSAFAAADEASAGLRSAADDSLAAAQSSANDLLTSAIGARDEASEGLSQLTSGLSDSASQASSAAADVASRAFEQLPQPVQNALSQAAFVVSEAASQAVAFANENPSGAAAVALPVLIGGPIAVWVTTQLTAYSGNKTPEEVLGLLESSDAVLVDIRSESERRRQGLPMLEGGAFGKGAVIPRFELGSSASMVRNAGQLQVDAIAATIAKLSKVRRRRTMVVVMDSGDGTAVPIAKRLLAFGIQNSSVVRGGFRQWVQNGLPVDVSSDSDYAVSPLQLLGARTTFAVGQSAASLRSPITLAASIISLALLVGALFDWHRTLQFIGATGVLLSILKRTSGYRSPQDLLDDVSVVATTVIRPVTAVATTTQVVGSAVSKAVGSSQQGSQQPQRQQQQQEASSRSMQPSQQKASEGGIKAVAVEAKDVVSEAASGSALGPDSAARD